MLAQQNAAACTTAAKSDQNEQIPHTHARARALGMMDELAVQISPYRSVPAEGVARGGSAQLRLLTATCSSVSPPSSRTLAAAAAATSPSSCSE